MKLRNQQSVASGQNVKSPKRLSLTLTAKIGQISYKNHSFSEPIRMMRIQKSQTRLNYNGEEIFEEIMAKNFAEVIKVIIPQIQETL